MKNNHYSLETIYNNQIEEFKKLKDEERQLDKDKKTFWYEEKLKELESKRNFQLEEAERSNFSDIVKKSIIAAVDDEFTAGEIRLEENMKKYNDLENQIKEKKHKLREDPKYIEAMKCRHEMIQANIEKALLEKNKKVADSELKWAQEAFELARKALEKAEKLVDEVNSSIDKNKEKLEKAKGDFAKEIVFELTNQEKILNVIESLNWTTITIDIDKYSDKSIWKYIRQQIFLKSRVSFSGGNYENDFNDNVMIIDTESIPEKVAVWDAFPIRFYYWDCKEGSINIKIIWNTWKEAVNGESKDEEKIDWQTILNEHDECFNKVCSIITTINSSWNINKNILAEFKSHIEQWWSSVDKQEALHNFARIYEYYGKKDIVIQKIFELPLNLKEIYLFAEIAVKRCFEMLEAKKNPFDQFQSMKTSLHRNTYKKSEKLEQTLLQFWLSLADIWRNDVPKSGHCRWWTCNWK